MKSTEISDQPFYILFENGLVKRLEHNIISMTGKKYNRKEIIRKPYINSNGYFAIEIKGTHYYIHRLLAYHFIPNPENKRTVNHKDGDKLNNSLSNLEWATDSENNQHAYNTGLKKGSFISKNGLLHPRSKKVIQIDHLNNSKVEFESARQASLKIGKSESYVCIRIKNGNIIDNKSYNYVV